jgi:hypothetical protein
MVMNGYSIGSVMIRVEQMEPSTGWLLFVLTMIIHACTFFILQSVADRFSTYMLRPHANIVKGVDPIPKKQAEMHENLPHETHSAQIRYMLPEFRLPIIGSKRTEYQQLHETLDVSVFR